MADQKQNKFDNNNLDPGFVALRCAEFFMSLGESCLEFYHKYNLEKQRKTKLIKKNLKQKPKIMKRFDGEGDQLNEEMKKKLPKKPLTAYIIYFQQKKPNFVQKYPGLNLSDLTKLIAKEWKQIDDNHRRPYLAQAQQDRKRYQTQMRQFRIKYGAVVTNNEEIEEENVIIHEELPEPEDLHSAKNLNDSDKKQEAIEQQQNENMEEQKPDDSAQNENDNDNQGQNDNENENDDNENENDDNENENENMCQNGQSEAVQQSQQKDDDE